MPSTSRCSNFSSPPLAAWREARRDDRELHHLLLEDGYAQRAFEHAFHRGAGIGDRFQALPPLEVRVHHAALDRTRTHDRHFDDQIVEARGFEARQHRLLRARFDLEHADGVGALAHRVDLGVFCRDVLHRKWGQVHFPVGAARGCRLTQSEK